MNIYKGLHDVPQRIRCTNLLIMTTYFKDNEYLLKIIYTYRFNTNKVIFNAYVRY